MSPHTSSARTAALLGIAVFLALGRYSPAAHADTNTIATTTYATATSSLQAKIDAQNQQIADLNQKIAEYQKELDQVGADKRTLQQAIRSLDLERNKMQAQVAATQRQINVTQLEIQQLGGAITDAEKTIAMDQIALGEAIRSIQLAESEPLFVRLLSSNTLTQAWHDVNMTIEAQDALRNQIQTLSTQKTALADSRTVSKQKQETLTSQKQSLTSQQQSLAATVASKNQLLAETNAKESIYQKLLAEAEAELESFSAFSRNAGGSKLLGSQTVCDSWGCYYNQRDTAWGSDRLNNTKYTLASDGCLVTAVAMVMTHYGYRDVTPVTINANPANFASYYPAYLSYTIFVDGMTVTRKSAYLDATLATGHPVIVGVRAYGGTHFVVLIRGRRGNYVMRDPYLADGKDVDFASHYSVRRIFNVTKLEISKS